LCVPRTSSTAISTLSLHDALPIFTGGDRFERSVWTVTPSGRHDQHPRRHARTPWPVTDDAEAFAGQCFLRWERQTFFPVPGVPRSEEHTSELQSRENLVCRLLLEK